MTKKSLKSFLFSILLLFGVFFGLRAAMAIDVGLNEVQGTIVLPSADIRVIIARIINVALGFLGVVVLLLILYGGFLWMTAGGEEEKIRKAKDWIKNGIIGLIIILSSFAITRFVLSRLLEATGGGVLTNEDVADRDVPPGGVSCPSGSMCVIRIIPKNPAPRDGYNMDSVVRIWTNKDINSSTVTAANVKIYLRSDASKTQISGTLSLNSGNQKEINFVPDGTCAPYGTGEDCFAPDTTFKVEIPSGSDLAAADGSAVSCGGLGACQAEFDVGHTVDSIAPEVSLNDPDWGQSLSVDSSVSLYANASDVVGISKVDFKKDGVLIDTEIPTGDPPPSSYSPIGTWNTSGLAPQLCASLIAEATDIDSNTGVSGAVPVVLRPAHCFDTERNFGETGLNCGGPAGTDYCGKCSGEVCEEVPISCRDYCRSAACVGGHCVDLPRITSFSPTTAGPGSYVTISGEFFGTTAGQVVFLGGAGVDDDRTASLAPCGAGSWSATSIIVIVPDGVSNGPIEIRTSAGSDTSNDSRGPNLGEFTNDSRLHPGLCSISPAGGARADRFELSGTGLGATQGSSVINFSATGFTTRSATILSWATTSVVGSVPDVNTGAVDVLANVGAIVSGLSSNRVPFRLAPLEAPFITSITPNHGQHSQTITIAGSNFGNEVGVVKFVAADGSFVIGEATFSPQCMTGLWRSDQIIIKVPDVVTGSRSVAVERRDGRNSNAVSFMVDMTPLTPALCASDPISSPIGTSVIFYGEGFTPVSDAWMTFAGGTLSAAAGDSTPTVLRVAIPSGSVTGPAVGHEPGRDSNPLGFRVVDCREPGNVCAAGTTCCSDGSCAVTCRGAVNFGSYAWHISTSLIPRVPRLVYECSATTVPSPSPWSGRALGEEVCANADVVARFDTSLDLVTLTGSNLVVKQCGATETSCGVAADRSIAGAVATIPDGRSGVIGLRFTPATLLSTSTWYEAKLRIGIQGSTVSGHQNLREDSTNCGAGFAYCWKFKIRNVADRCRVGSIELQPSDKLATEIHESGIDFKSICRADNDACTTISCGGYAFTWDSSNDAEATVLTSSTSINTADPLRETVAGSPVIITSQIPTEGVSDTSNLTINFTDPAVVSYEPNCVTACVNAGVRVIFNTPMCGASHDGCTYPNKVIDRGAIKIKKCANESCNTFVSSINISSASLNFATERIPLSDGPEYARGQVLTFDPSPPDEITLLEPNTYYRVMIDGAGQSTSGMALTGLNYTEAGHSYFSWIFKTKNDASLCQIDNVEMNPASATVRVVGERARYGAVPHGSPDACSPYGQVLVDGYNWAWASRDETVATLVRPFAQTGATGFPRGCSSVSCLNTGSGGQAGSTPICGNGITETSLGEECDGGAGCSATTCLHTGSVADSSICGDSSVGIGEDCDDGNTISGDGCSSQCLSEGSVVGISECGNGSIGVGEECDDGNLTSGDGCSSTCLHEGSRQGLISLCGDRIIEDGEDCDDGNIINGDKCSSLCLNEGTLACSSHSPVWTTNCCGNGGRPETGEDCDDGNIANDDGCSSRCLKEGSSYRYSAPSYCGDRVTGTGEECEATGGSTRTASSQLAEAQPGGTLDASGRKSTTIDATASTKTGSATFSIQCGFTADDQCPTTGVCAGLSGCGRGTDSCCYKRPTVARLAPANESENNCRNPLIAIKFNSGEAMDTSSFTGRVKVAKWVSGACPAGSSEIRLTRGEEERFAAAVKEKIQNQTSGNYLSRLWGKIKNLVSGLIVPAEAAHPIGGHWCEGSVTGRTSGTTSGTGAGIFSELNFELTGSALESSTWYLVRVVGDHNITDGEVEGIRSASGVGLNGDITWFFETGERICLADIVRVEDGDLSDAEPSLFTTTTPRNFVAKVKNRHDGRLDDIVPITGTYDWTWQSWTSSEPTVVPVPVRPISTGGTSTASIAPSRNNGFSSIGAGITISTDVLSSPSTRGNEINGFRSVNVFICENPWPVPEEFPFEDSSGSNDGVVCGGAGGPVCGNFSTGYCRDAGDENLTTDDLPDLTLQTVSSPPAGILKEYFFKVGDSNDVIGFRMINNPDFYSAERWYAGRGFRGSPQSFEIDGYGAVRDGRTVYINAANRSCVGASCSLQSYIYVFSYNENADAETINIYNQLLQNLLLNLDIITDGGNQNNNLCAADDSRSCSSDFDCETGACNSQKRKLIRDMRRLEDFRDIEAILLSYRLRTGYYPALESGTFLRAMTTSTWPSWIENLSREVGSALPTDPLNRFKNCPTLSDPNTCFNQTAGTFICPANSHVYEYIRTGPMSYELKTDLELSWSWSSGTTGLSESGITPGTDDVSLFATPDGGSSRACTGGVQGNSTVCGDGIVGTGEICELGQTRNWVCSPPSPAPAGSGRIIQRCNNCTDFVDQTGASCVASYCDDGVVQRPNAAGVDEVCDDGANNGHYGYCAADCGVGRSGIAAFGPYCGDGQLAGTEVCDCGVNGTRPLRCSAFNGQYPTTDITNRDKTCAWNCTSPGPYCGDGLIQTPPEQCDGNRTIRRGVCSNDSTRICNTETVLTDCPAASPAPTCQNLCDTTLRCSNAISVSCTTEGRTGLPCSGTGVCTRYPQFRVQGCSSSCQRIVAGLDCAITSEVYCGNRVIEAGSSEQCDDGNDSSNDACTTACRLNICGDGFAYTGVEACDLGARNGTPCPASYGATCNYCSTSCSYVTQTGAFCGDGLFTPGAERCDYSARPILTGTAPDGYSNTFSQCGLDCRSVCPPDTSSTNLNFQTTPRSTSHAFSSDESQQLAITACRMGFGITLDVAIGRDVLSFPSPLSVVFVLDNSGSMYDRDDVECDSSLRGNESRIYCLKKALKGSASTTGFTSESVITRLLDSRPSGNIKIGLVSFSGEGAGPALRKSYYISRLPLSTYQQSEYDAVPRIEPSNADSNGLLTDTIGNRNQLYNAINNYLVDSYAYGGTPTFTALRMAKSILDSDTTARSKVVILMSDGEADDCSGTGCPKTDVEAGRMNQASDGITIFTISYPNLIAQMNNWAEQTTGSFSYSYDGNNLETMFTNIISAITGITIQVSEDSGFIGPTSDVTMDSSTYSTTVDAGYGIPLNIRLGRNRNRNYCNNDWRNIHIKPIFIATGTGAEARVTLSNLRWSYCPLRASMLPMITP